MKLREEIELILKMLEEGKITTEESAKLIEIIQETDDNDEYEAVNDIMDNMADMTKHISELGANVGKEILEAFENADTGSLLKTAREMDYPLVRDSDVYISTTGKLSFSRNDREQDHGENKIVISVRIKESDKWEEFVKVSRSDQSFKLEVIDYEEPVDIDVLLPELKFNKVIGICKNGKIEFDWINADSLELFSNNGKIIGSNTKVESMNLATTNAKVSLETCYGDLLKVSTTNSKVSLSECVFEDVIDVSTTNGTISLLESTGDEILLVTANGGIRMEDNKVNKCKLATSNGKIFIKNNDVFNDKVVDIEAITSNGSITALVPGKMGAGFTADTGNSGTIQLGRYMKPVEWEEKGERTRFTDDNTRSRNNSKSKTYWGEMRKMAFSEFRNSMDRKPENLVYATGESKSGRRGDTYTELNLKTTMGNISIGWG